MRCKLRCPRKRAVILSILATVGYVSGIANANAQDSDLIAAAMRGRFATYQGAA